MSAAANTKRWRGLMDETVQETFSTMLGQECVPTGEAMPHLESMIARVRFSGALLGECALIFAHLEAAKLAEMLAGGAVDDAIIADSVGELCNVVAGGWKRRLRPPASGASLSVPLVAREELEMPASMCQSYEFDGTRFAVGLTVDAVTEDGNREPQCYLTTAWKSGEVSRLANSLSDEE